MAQGPSGIVPLTAFSYGVPSLVVSLKVSNTSPSLLSPPHPPPHLPRCLRARLVVISACPFLRESARHRTLG